MLCGQGGNRGPGASNDSLRPGVRPKRSRVGRLLSKVQRSYNEYGYLYLYLYLYQLPLLLRSTVAQTPICHFTWFLLRTVVTNTSWCSCDFDAVHKRNRPAYLSKKDRLVGWLVGITGKSADGVIPVHSE